MAGCNLAGILSMETVTCSAQGVHRWRSGNKNDQFRAAANCGTINLKGSGSRKWLLDCPTGAETLDAPVDVVETALVQRACGAHKVVSALSLCVLGEEVI